MSEITDATKIEAPEDTLGGGAGPQFARGSVGNVPGDDDDDDEPSSGKQQKERRKIEIKFIQDKLRRHITFLKRKAGIMKKAYELLVLTGTQVLLLVVSETGLVYTFTTPKLQPLVTKSEGKNLIQACLNAPEEGLGDDGGDASDAHSPELAEPSPGPPPQHVPGPGPGVAHQAAPVPHPQQLQAHMPHGMPYQGQAHPQQGLPMPQAGGYNDPYQYFGNMGNGNIQGQQQYQ